MKGRRERRILTTAQKKGIECVREDS